MLLISKATNDVFQQHVLAKEGVGVLCTSSLTKTLAFINNKLPSFTDFKLSKLKSKEEPNKATSLNFVIGEGVQIWKYVKNITTFIELFYFGILFLAIPFLPPRILLYNNVHESIYPPFEHLTLTCVVFYLYFTLNSS